jgi:hypothetical protein
MNLKLKIINLEKLNELKDSIDSIIYVHFNNKKYLAKGQFVFLSSIQSGCDYFFSLDEDGKIIFFEDEIIDFIGFIK